MTTNITPIEALKKIYKILDKIILECDSARTQQTLEETVHKLATKAFDISHQALAQQEPQEKTFTLKEVREVLNKIANNLRANPMLLNDIIRPMQPIRTETSYGFQTTSLGYILDIEYLLAEFEKECE